MLTLEVCVALLAGVVETVGCRLCNVADMTYIQQVM